MRRSAKSFFIFFIFISSVSFSQDNGLGNSPYSMYGVGDLIWNGTTRNMGMGGTGVAAPAANFVNLLNPALLVYSTAASFEMAALGQYKTIETTEEWQSTTGATIHYGAFGIPLARRWTLSLGLLPYSDISYERRYTNAVVDQSGVTYRVKETGTGGLSKAFLGNGFRINKNFALGAEVAYFFGNKEELSQIALDLPNATTDAIQSQYYFRALDIKLGGYYSGVIDSVKNINVGLGLTYNLNSDLKTDLTTTREIPTSGSNSFAIDTFAQSSIGVTIPQEFRLGLSLSKPGKWSITADASYIPWEEFQFEGNDTGLRNSINYHFGGEFVPNPTSVTNVFARTYYRLGGYIRQPPIPYNGQFINDFGINFGLSLPITKFAFLNFAVMAGQRGTTDYGLIREIYTRYSLGLVINDSNWFKRLKLE